MLRTSQQWGMLTVMEEHGMTGTIESCFLNQSFFRASSSSPFDPLQVPSSLTSNAALKAQATSGMTRGGQLYCAPPLASTSLRKNFQGISRVWQSLTVGH